MFNWFISIHLYNLVRHYIAQFGDFFVNSYDIDWDPRSYLANRAQYPNFNYSLLEQSTRQQRVYNFDGPHPYAKVVTSFKNTGI